MSKYRYEGIQSILNACGQSGCHFLVLLSITEEFTKKEFDLINTIKLFQKNYLLGEDFYVFDALKILNILTSKKWERSELMTKLPKKIKDNEYTEVVYFNETTGFTHYRRRCFDTLKNSKTVKFGKVKGYYIYTVEV